MRATKGHASLRRLRLSARLWAVSLDALTGIVIVAAATSVAVAVATPVAPTWASIVLGVWTAIATIWALPAIVVLHLSPPPVPLKERSALFSSAAWFGRTLWAGIVFALSILFGTLAGVAASRSSDSGGDFGAILSATAQLAVWPVLAAVAAVAYVVMGVRWFLDLGTILRDGTADRIWADLELRWLGTSHRPAWYVRIRPHLLGFVIGGLGRFGLGLTVVTLGVNVVVTCLVMLNR